MPRHTSAVIELQRVDKIYKLEGVSVHALRNVSLQVRHGEFTAIVGPSGSGKSTLMHIIGALDIPTHGTVILDGQDISRLDDDELARVRGRKVGFVFQSFNLVPTLNAVENVELPLMFQGVDAGERRRRATEVLARVGLAGRIHHRPLQMSGGEQQRVAIARALVSEPELILADEPTGNLDSRNGAEIIALLEELNAEGKTIVVVTHEPHLAKRARRRIFIRDGSVEKEEK